MRAGSLNKRVTFERRRAIDDGGGGGGIVWEAFLTVWGGLRPERGRERLEAGRLEAVVAGVLQVRSSSDARGVTEADRVVIDNVPHQIRAIVNPDQRNRMLEMTVERGVAS